MGLVIGFVYLEWVCKLAVGFMYQKPISMGVDILFQDKCAGKRKCREIGTARVFMTAKTTLTTMKIDGNVLSLPHPGQKARLHTLFLRL